MENTSSKVAALARLDAGNSYDGDFLNGLTAMVELAEQRQGNMPALDAEDEIEFERRTR